MKESQNSTSFYYVRRKGKLIGPLPMERISYCCSCHLLSVNDEISADQVNWSSIASHNASVFEKLTGAFAHSGNNAENAGISHAALNSVGNSDENPYTAPIAGNNKTAVSQKRYAVIILCFLIAMSVCGVLGTGTYLAYRYFTGSNFVSSEIKAIHEALSLEEKYHAKKITRKQFWAKARELALSGNSVIGRTVYCKTPGVNEEEKKMDKKCRQEIFDILLQKNDPWAKWVKLTGEAVLTSGFLGKKALPSDKNRDNALKKSMICVPLGKIDFEEIRELIFQTDDIALLLVIGKKMYELYTVWNRKENNLPPPRELIHQVAERLLQLHYNAFAYFVDKTYYYPANSHDNKTVTKKLLEEEEESVKIKLEALDFKGRGVFIVSEGTISYKHLEGKRPYRIKIDGEAWNTEDEVKLLQEKSSFAIPLKMENIRPYFFRDKLYLIPERQGIFSMEIRLYKRLDQETE